MHSRTLVLRSLSRSLFCSLSFGAFGLASLSFTFASNTQTLREDVRAVPGGTKQDFPDQLKKAIMGAKKEEVLEVVGMTRVPIEKPIVRVNKLIFRPGATLIITGITGLYDKPLVIVAGELILQDPSGTSAIIRERDSAFFRVPRPDGAAGEVGKPDFRAPYKGSSANGGPGENGHNGQPGWRFVPTSPVYIFVGKMTRPDLPSRFVIDFSGFDSGPGGAGGAGGRGGHGDQGFASSCDMLVFCSSGPGRGGDGGPGGAGGRGGDGAPGGPGFDVEIGGSRQFVELAQQFTILNKGGEPGPPGPGGVPGEGGEGGPGGQVCGSCTSRGNGQKGPTGTSLGPGNPSYARGADGKITFVYDVEVADLLRP